MQTRKSIAIIDCAVKDPAIACFNRLQRRSEKSLSYHNFPAQGLRSLNLEKDISGIISLGSHSNVGDDSNWHSPLSDFLMEHLLKGVPVFGICFSHQLMAHTFGSTLSKNPNGKTLEGLREIHMNNGSSHHFFTSHNYQISKLGPDLEVIGVSDDSPFEFIKHKTLPYQSCQSHPEGSDFFLENEISFKLAENQRDLGLKSGLSFLCEFISSV